MGAYSGTILDQFDPTDIVFSLKSMLDKHYDYSEEEKDALRHYIGMQAIADQYGTTIAGGLGKLWEGPVGKKAENEQIQSEVDLLNNMKALEDYSKGNILEINVDTNRFDETILDSLLKEITIPPKYVPKKKKKKGYF